CGIGVVEVEEIDRINILNASLLAMVKAFHGLKPTPDYLLIDGRETIPPGWFKTGKKASGSLPQQRTIIKGDQLCISIAAASILAKVARDEIMVEFDKKYPEYGFASHKGYSSVVHLEVKTRSDDRFGTPFEAVEARKQQKMIRAAQFFLHAKGLQQREARFDVVGISWPGRQPVVEHIENAFELFQGVD